MARSPIRRPYQQVPRGRIPFRAVFWLLAMGTCLAGIGALAASAMSQSSVSSSRLFGGKMASQIQPVQIHVPADVVVEDLLVTNGETVRHGQTLLTFDVAAMTSELAELKELSLADQQTLKCSIDAPVEGEKPALPTPSANEPRDCQDIRQEHQNLIALFAAENSKSQKEINLIATYLTEATAAHRRNRDVAKTHTMLDRILALSLTKASLENARDLAEVNHKRALNDLAARRSELTASVQKALRERHKRIANLEALIDTPRVLAPYSGKIVRVRRPPKGNALPTKVEVFSLLPQQEAGYAVEIPVKDADIALFQVGDRIYVETIGLPALVNDLQAEIQGISRDDQGRFLVRANLTIAATQTLAASPYSRQIVANSSAVNVRVHKVSVTAREFFWKTLANVLVLDNTPIVTTLMAQARAMRDEGVLPALMKASAFEPRH